MPSNSTKLKHDISSDVNSIFECCEILLLTSDISDDVALGLKLILDKKEGLLKNIEISFDLLSKPS